MLAEPVQSDKKGELVLSDGRFVSVYKVKVFHLLAARDPDDLAQSLKLATLVTRIDEKSPTIEEMLNMEVHDFMKIMHYISK